MIRAWLRHLLPAFYRVKVWLFPNFVPYRVRWLRKAIAYLHRSDVRFRDNVMGHRMYLDETDSLGLATHAAHEPMETALLQMLVKPGQVVADVGANIGYYTLLFARWVGAEGRVFAFEPGRDNFDLLVRNVALNGYRNVTTENRAVSDRDGTLRLYVSEHFQSDHRTYDSGDNRDSIEIAAVRLDDYFPPGGRKVDIVKMDIQGAEYAALLGMRRVLTDNPDVQLLMEFAPVGLHRAGATAAAVLDFLRDAGFRVYEIDESCGDVVPAPTDALLSRYTVRNEAYTNLLCVREPLDTVALSRRLRETMARLT